MEVFECTLAKEMLEENVEEMASSKKRNRRRRILFSLTRRQRCCQRPPQRHFPDSVPTIPHENRTARRRDPTLGVEVESVSPAVEVLVGQCVLRASAATDMGVGGAPSVKLQIPGTALAPIRLWLRFCPRCEWRSKRRRSAWCRTWTPRRTSRARSTSWNHVAMQRTEVQKQGANSQSTLATPNGVRDCPYRCPSRKLVD